MSEFNPDWTIAPAATLREWMALNGMSPPVLATACMWRCTHDRPHMALGLRDCVAERKRVALALIEDVLGKRPLTDMHAEALERGTRVSATFWLNSEAMYRVDLEAGRTDTTGDD